MNSEKISHKILLNNRQFLVANKPPGMPCMPDQTGDKSLQEILESYCQQPLYPVHRLDRPVSGVMLFAKNKRALALLQSQFASRNVEKEYIALVRNKPPKDQDEIVHFLTEANSRNMVSVSQNPETAKECKLKYKILGCTDHYYILNINPTTGRQHQIRVQLAAIGCPIKGDVKYGDRRSNKDKGIHLHARNISFLHPISFVKESVQAPFPEESLWLAVSKIIDNAATE